MTRDFTVTIKFDHAATVILARILDAIEGKQQQQIDKLVARLTASGAKLEDAVENVQLDQSK